MSPSSWKDSSGTGTIEYFPLGKALVVNNTSRVQAQVKSLLETMRRVQAVQIVAETKIITVNAACFVKLQGFLPQLKNDSHAILTDAETRKLIRQAQDDAETGVMQTPKITFFPGQRFGFASDPGFDLKLNALVAANLQHLDLDVKATIGKLNFTKALRMEDGETLAQSKRSGGGYLIFLITPRVLIEVEEEVAPLKAESPKAAPAGGDRR